MVNIPKKIKCPDWNLEYKAHIQNKEKIKKALIEIFKNQHNGELPLCPELDGGSRNSDTPVREENIALSSIPELAPLAPQLEHFRYQVVEPINPPPPGEKVQTVLMLAGGPGTNISTQIASMRLPNQRLIVADYLGMGANELSGVKVNESEQFLSIDHFKLLTQKIIDRERNEHNMGDYIVTGHSYGSVAATVVGAHLSQGNIPPKAVFISGVVKPTDATIPETAIPEVEWKAKLIAGKWCVLPQGHACFDDQVLNHLNKEEQTFVQNFIQETLKDPSTPFAQFFRDAFHDEASKSPLTAAQFLKKYVLPQKNSNLYCWFNNHYDQIPWIERLSSPSAIAAIEALNCQTQPRGPVCQECFFNFDPYDSNNHQVKSHTTMYYANGDQDTQTPLAGAKSHFDLQKNPNKSFVTVEGGGHDLFGNPNENPAVIDLYEYFSKALGQAYGPPASPGFAFTPPTGPGQPALVNGIAEDSPAYRAGLRTGMNYATHEFDPETGMFTVLVHKNPTTIIQFRYHQDGSTILPPQEIPKVPANP